MNGCADRSASMRRYVLSYFMFTNLYLGENHSAVRKGTPHLFQQMLALLEFEPPEEFLLSNPSKTVNMAHASLCKSINVRSLQLFTWHCALNKRQFHQAGEDWGQNHFFLNNCLRFKTSSGL